MDERTQQIIEDSEKIRNRNRDLEGELHGLKVENERLKEENETLFATQGGADPQNLRDALQWLHDQGGIGAVYSRYKDVVLGEAEEALEVAYSEDIEKRLMPEGMEWLVEAWPRFEDDAPVRIGDEISWKDDGGKVNSIELQDGGYFILHAADGAEDWILPQYFPGERVKRPASKVLDADGAEIRERIVRCVDCKYSVFHPLSASTKMICELFDNQIMDRDDFCSRGKRYGGD